VRWRTHWRRGIKSHAKDDICALTIAQERGRADEVLAPLRSALSHAWEVWVTSALPWASISVLHDKSYHGSRGYQLGKSFPIKWHHVPNPTIFVAGGNVIKHGKRRRKRSPQKVSVVINMVMEAVTVPGPIISPMRLSENLLIGMFSVGIGIDSLSPGYSEGV
jgi:hypothetical protein